MKNNFWRTGQNIPDGVSAWHILQFFGTIHQERGQSHWFESFKGHKLAFSVQPLFTSEFVLFFHKMFTKLCLNPPANASVCVLGVFFFFFKLWLPLSSESFCGVTTPPSSVHPPSSAQWPRWSLASEISSHLSLLSSSPPPPPPPPLFTLLLLLFLFPSAHKMFCSLSLSLLSVFVFHFSLCLASSLQIFHLSGWLILYLSFYESL